MIEARFFGKRLENVQNLLDTHKLDAIVLNSHNEGDFTTKPNIFYLTNFLGVWPATLIITKNKTILFTNEMDKAPAQSMVKDLRVFSKIKEMEKILKGKTIGIDGYAPYRSHTFLAGIGCKLTDISEEILKIRSIKDKTEIQKIKLACNNTDKLLKVVQNNLFSGSESKLDIEIKKTALKNNFSLAFPNIVAGDSHSGEIHYMENNGHFSKILMADIGAMYDHYNSDFTRTFLLKPIGEMNKAHEHLVALHGILEDMAVPGTKVKELSKKAFEFLKKNGYKKQHFGNFHSLGHGVGLEVHESPYVGLGEDILEENMIITIEPGIYFQKRFGIRIEDTCLVTKKGVERLSKFVL